MKKLFISQPMRGKTDEEILLERKRAIEAAKTKIGEDVEVIDSFFKPFRKFSFPEKIFAPQEPNPQENQQEHTNPTDINKSPKAEMNSHKQQYSTYTQRK